MKVRFNLGRGINYRKWQITSSIGEKVHYDPWEYQLELQDSILCNKRQHADKIFGGGGKHVCSWINTKMVEKHPVGKFDISKLRELKYNPRISPHWTDVDDNVLDDTTYRTLVTSGNKIYVLNIHPSE